jgi:hypothetical protein
MNSQPRQYRSATASATQAPSAVTRVRELPVGAVPLVQAGEVVQAHQPIAELRLQGSVQLIHAGIAGRVVDVTPGRSITLEGMAYVLHGMLGVGQYATGALAFLPQGESLALVPIPPGSVIVYPYRVPATLLQRAVAGGAAGIIAASAAAHELEAFARVDLTSLLDGFPAGSVRIPLTIVLTEGLGEAVMASDAYELFVQQAGASVLLNGDTRPRDGVRPEVLLPATASMAARAQPSASPIGPGAHVVLASGPYRGARGRVLHLYQHSQYSDSGILLPSAQVQLADGRVLPIPLAALERLG